MWVMTTRGFHSVVEHRDDPGKLLVRARCQADIEALAELIPATPVLLDTADYAWRIEATRAQWSDALLALADGIRYPNFKAAVADPAHHDAYMRVWSALLPLDDR